MKNKASLSLMEQLIMLLVFAIAAAVCLRAFAGANRIAGESRARDRAAIEAQSAAELLKHYRGDMSAAADALGADYDGQHIQYIYSGVWDADDKDEYSVQISPADTGSDLLGRADVTVTDESGSTLFSLPVCWQEGEYE